MRRPLTIALALLFFVGFPLTGLFWAWNSGHRLVESSASKFGEETLALACDPWDWSAMRERLAVDHEEELARTTFEELGDRLGSFESSSSSKILESLAREEGGVVVHRVTLQMDTEFARGPAEITMRLRRSAEEGAQEMLEYPEEEVQAGGWQLVGWDVEPLSTQTPS